MDYNNYNGNREFKQNKFQNNNQGNSINRHFEEPKPNIHFENDEIVGDNNKNYVDVAKDVIEKLKNKGDLNDKKLTTSKIRSIMSMIAEIYKLVIMNTEQKISTEIISKLQYFKIRCLYEAGREQAVKDFVDKSNIVELIKEIADSRKKLINYYHYIEALVAWFKYSGGKEN